MKSRKIIGVDLDDVLLNFCDSLCKWHNNNYKTTLCRDDVVSYTFAEIWNCTYEESVRRIDEFFVSDLHRKAEPVDGAVDHVRKLKEKGYVFHIITAKPDTLSDVTNMWLETNYPNIFEGVHFTNHYQGVEKRREKSEVCRELGVQLFIDDSHSNVIDVSSVGIPSLLFSAPWNRAPVPDYIRRVSSWAEIAEEIEKI